MENKVELIGFYGSDITHAQSAWTSTNRELTPDKLNRVDKLIKQLAEAGHHSVFEKSSLHFLVTTDVATHIHLLKHRIGVSINAESARYKELKDDKYYIPVDFDAEEAQEVIEVCEMLLEKYHQKVDRMVKKGYDRKRAKESARFILPYANQITSDIMFNWRSFVHFQGLRNSSHAQLEVREVAQNMLKIVKELPGNPFKYTIEAFGYGDKNGN
jgi:thymidylate synthase (FAD)